MTTARMCLLTDKRQSNWCAHTYKQHVTATIATTSSYGVCQCCDDACGAFYRAPYGYRCGTGVSRWRPYHPGRCVQKSSCRAQRSDWTWWTEHNYQLMRKLLTATWKLGNKKQRRLCIVGCISEFGKKRERAICATNEKCMFEWKAER